MSTGFVASATVFVDSGAYAGLILKRDVNHDRAHEIARMLEAQRIRLCSTNVVVIEAYTVILARSSRASAIEFLERLEQSQDLIVRVTEDDERRAIEIVRRYHDKKFSLVDATSFAVMERLGIAIAFSFDRHFAQYGLQVLGKR